MTSLISLILCFYFKDWFNFILFFFELFYLSKFNSKTWWPEKTSLVEGEGWWRRFLLRFYRWKLSYNIKLKSQKCESREIKNVKMLPPENYSSLQNKTEEEESTNSWDMTGTSLWSRISPFLMLHELRLMRIDKELSFFPQTLIFVTWCRLPLIFRTRNSV